MKIRMQKLGNLVLFSAAVLTLNVALWGQATNSADVTGSVTDPSGAVVPGVKVSVKDIDKNTEKTFITNDSGLYDTGPLVPSDQYLITFSKEGFASLQRGPMTLRSGVTGLNVQLTIGQATQQISIVESGAPLLETTTAEISSTVPQETLKLMPQTGGIPDWQSFITFLPGTRGNGGNNGNSGMGGTSVNGSMPFSNALLDGASTSSPMSNNVINTPIFDTLGEVKMSSSAFSAQYGGGGVVYNQISRGGSNQFHGMAYDYFKNTALNAAPFGFNGVSSKTPQHFNNFGGNIGGPVIKNKVFFFFGIDHTINHTTPNVSFITVPTAAVRSGNFTGLNPIYDPTTQSVNPTTGAVTRQLFPNNTIPSNMLDAVAKNVQSYYPTPNLAGQVVNGIATNNYNYLAPGDSPKRKYFGRFDADITSTNRVTGSAAWNDGPSKPFSPVAPINRAPGDVMNQSGQLSDYWTISPSLTNEMRIGFMGEFDQFHPDTIDQGYPEKLGLKFSKADVFPTVSINNYYTLGSGLNTEYKEVTLDLSDQVTLIKGRHVLHFGGGALLFRANSTAWGNMYGANVGFTGVYTAGSNTGPLASGSGSSYADFLLGYVQNWSAVVSPQYGGRLRNPGIFIQDDFKVTPKLTLNLGLRWEGNTGWTEVNGNARSFDPNVINPATNAPGALWFGTTKANGRDRLQAAVWKNILPRFGFAYQLGDKTVIRGGIGMYTFPWNVDSYGGGLGQASSSSGNQTDSTGNVSPVVILSSDGNTNYQGSKGAAINTLYRKIPNVPDALNGQSVGFFQYTLPSPLLRSWNVTIQRQVTQAMVADFGYVGSNQSHLPFTSDLNQVPESLLGPNSANFRPYKFQSVTGNTSAGIANYNAFQTGLTRRMASGLMFNVNYTWSHMLSNQDSSGWGSQQGATPYQRSYDPMANYGNSNFDIRHMLKAHGSYDLPFGGNKKFAINNKAADWALGGWTLFGTFLRQGGAPFTVNMLVNNSFSLSSNNLWFPNLVGDPYDVPGGQNIDHWFNVNAFAAPTPGTFGNNGRNTLNGPPMTVVNASLHKVFKFTERMNVDFSANATNLINHPSFSIPDKAIGTGRIGRISGTSVGSRAMELVAKFRF
ncbi:MAG: TonB-dependent receptor [Candidatus Solibacter sp.]